MTGSRKVARNVAASLAAQVVSWGLTFLVTLYLPRYVGAEGLGQLAFAGAFLAVFGVIAPLGTGTVLLKEAGRRPEATPGLLRAALAFRVPAALGGVCAAALLALALGYDAATRAILLGASLSMIVSAVSEPLGAVLQGQERMHRSGLAMVAERAAGAGLTVALVVMKAPLWAIAAAGTAAALVSLALNAAALRPELRALRSAPPAEQRLVPTVRYLVLAGTPYLGWTLFQTLYGQADPLVLKAVSDDATVGWYAAAARLVGTALFLPVAVCGALTPTLSRLWHQGERARFERLAGLTFSSLMLIGMPIALCLALLPGQVLGLLHYPASFSGCVPVLRAASLSVILHFAGMILGTIVIASDGQDRMAKASLWGALVGVPGCVAASWLADRFWHNGAVGAMLSDAALEAFLLAVYARGLSVRVIGRDGLGRLARGAAAAVATTLVFFVGAWATGHDAGLWLAIPCALFYAVAALCLRVLDPQVFDIVRALAARKAGAT